MMSFVFVILMVVGFAWGIFTADATTMSNAALNGAGDAITLTLSMCGAYALWMGVFQVAEDAGLVAKISRLFARPLRFLFRGIPKDSKAYGFIALNISANMLGLGNAATPSGIAAMKELHKHNRDSKAASKAMCMLLIINAASIQLIPTGVMAVRNAQGSINAAAIVLPTILSSVCALTFSIAITKFLEGRDR